MEDEFFQQLLCADGRASMERHMLGMLDKEWVMAEERSSKGHCELFWLFMEIHNFIIFDID